MDATSSALPEQQQEPQEQQEQQEQLPGEQQQQQQEGEQQQQQQSLDKIRELLRTKDDTSRFVGLALLKSVLDNAPQLREDETAVRSLWESISPRFLDRLLRTGSAPGGGGGGGAHGAQDMLDLAVAVLHTFASLLPDAARGDARFVDKIPRLVSCLVHSSKQTEESILQTLLLLVGQREGALALAQIDDLSPLTEIAPSQPLVLDILSLAWLQSMMAWPASNSSSSNDLSARIDRTIEGLVSSFKGTDAVTLLAFLADTLRKLDPRVIPQNPRWIQPLVQYVRNLVGSRPTAAGRAAYTNLAAALLQVYPGQTAPLLFAGDVRDEKPFSYLFVHLLLVDLRSSFPTLLEQLNSPDYPATAGRLASAFDIVSHFVGFLVRSLDEEDAPPPPSSPQAPAAPPAIRIPPDRLLALRKAVAETMSATIEYLRDRWDASVAGAMGLHPSARSAAATNGADRAPLAWDSKTDALAAGRDPLVLAALRALAIWLREDDNDMLRREAAGLIDMLVDLYKDSAQPPPPSLPHGAAGGGGYGEERLDFRGPVLVALEGITAAEEGTEALLSHEGWEVLTEDMLATLYASSSAPRPGSVGGEPDAARGVEIVRVLLPVVEAERPGTREAWMAVVTRVAAWPGLDDDDDEEEQQKQQQQQQVAAVREFQVAVLQLVTALLVNAHPGMRRRYRHSTSAVIGLATQLRARCGSGGEGDALRESLDDVLATLASLV